MNRYVIGFLFNGDSSKVCLIEKNRPKWQRGRLNGVGGHIENCETPLEAMEREFQEEAGVMLEWRQFLFVTGNNYELYCFTAKNHSVRIKTMTDEKVSWHSVKNLPPNILPNLAWIIPMANYKFPLKAVVEHESEEC